MLCERFIIERRAQAEEVIVVFFDIDRITDLEDFEPGQLRKRALRK